LTGDGGTFRQPAGRAEGFEFTEVPPGEYTLSLEAGSGAFWLLTTVPYGQSGQPVTVEQGEVSRQTLGVALSEPIPVEPRLIGLAYEDANADGVIGPGECGIAGSGVESVAGTEYASHFPNDPAGSFQLMSDTPDFPALTVTPGGLLDGWWLQTGPPPEPGYCASKVAPQPRYAEGVFELNVGFQQTHGSSSISGVIFLDEDGNGQRDESEMVMYGAVFLAPECQGEYRPQLFLPVEDGGRFELTGLPAGDYALSFAYANSAGFQPESPEMSVSVADGQTASVDYALRRVPTGALIVYVYDDTNGNGRFDEDLQEPVDTNNSVCYTDVATGDLECVEPGRVARGLQIPVGTYEVYIPYTDGVHLPQTAEVREGQAVTLFFARRQS
jgi:hypothetical protein